LDWTQAQLAERARVSLSTVKGFESGERSPIVNNIEALERAFTNAGIMFIDADGQAPGIAFDEKAAGKPKGIKG